MTSESWRRRYPTSNSGGCSGVEEPTERGVLLDHDCEVLCVAVRPGTVP